MYALIVSPTNDIHSLAVKRELVRRHPSIVPIVWDVAGLGSRSRLSFEECGYWLEVDGKRLAATNVGSVWWRRTSQIQVAAEVVDPQARAFARSEHRHLLWSFLSSLRGRTINDPWFEQPAEFKPNQLALAASCGLATPRTIVTSDLNVAKRAIGGINVVVKGMTSPSGCFGEARLVPWEALAGRQRELEVCPVIFQEPVVPADDIRVTVVEERLFCALLRRHSAAALEMVDWRLDPTVDGLRVDAPEPTATSIRQLMQRLGLRYGALDIRRRHSDGEWVFLEVNPAGQYLWTEMDAGLDISAAIADLLAGIACRKACNHSGAADDLSAKLTDR